MLAEGELRSNLDDSDRVRDLQDKVADLKAEVIYSMLVAYVRIVLQTIFASTTNKINRVSCRLHFKQNH